MFDDNGGNSNGAFDDDADKDNNSDSFPSSGPFDVGNNNGVCSAIHSVSFQSFGNNNNSDSFPSSGFVDGGVNTDDTSVHGTDDKDLFVGGNTNRSGSDARADNDSTGG